LAIIAVRRGPPRDVQRAACRLVTRDPVEEPVEASGLDQVDDSGAAL
jgi:hypothetical protein